MIDQYRHLNGDDLSPSDGLVVGIEAFAARVVHLNYGMHRMLSALVRCRLALRPGDALALGVKKLLDAGSLEPVGKTATRATDAFLVFGFEVEDGSLDWQRCQLLAERPSVLREVKDELAVGLIRHGTAATPRFVLGMTSLLKRAPAGELVELDRHLMVIFKDRADELLEQAARALGLTHKPGRWLLAAWGG